MLRLAHHIRKPAQQVICKHLASIHHGTSCSYHFLPQTASAVTVRSLWTRALSRSTASEESSASSHDKDLPETLGPQTAVEKHAPAVPVIYRPDSTISKRVAKREARFEKKYDVMPTEVLVYDNHKRCRRLKWMFHVLSVGASLSWLNLASFLLQNYTKFNESSAFLAKCVELVTLYRKLPPDFPYHTQMFIFVETSLVTLFLILWVHLTLNRQLVRLYMDKDYGRFKAAFVEANKYNERTAEFSYKDVVPLTHPLPRIQNFAIKGLPYYLDERDFKHPKYYAYFKGSFDEILDKKV